MLPVPATTNVGPGPQPSDLLAPVAQAPASRDRSVASSVASTSNNSSTSRSTSRSTSNSRSTSMSVAATQRAGARAPGSGEDPTGLESSRGSTPLYTMGPNSGGGCRSILSEGRRGSRLGSRPSGRSRLPTRRMPPRKGCPAAGGDACLGSRERKLLPPPPPAPRAILEPAGHCRPAVLSFYSERGSVCRQQQQEQEQHQQKHQQKQHGWN